MDIQGRFWCHQCRSEIRPDINMHCGQCGGEFIEEIDPENAPQSFVPANPVQSPQQTQTQFGSPHVHHHHHHHHHPHQRVRGMPPFPFPFAPPATPAFMSSGTDVFSQMMQQVSTMIGQLGMPNPHQPMVFQTNIHTGPVLNFNNMLFGDHVFGSNFEQLLNHLFESAPHRGTPPAAKSEVDNLATVKIEQSHIDNNEECAVCKEPFELAQEAKKMPCKHLFHESCIIPWLKMHNSCPVCRAELKTDDPDYENRKQQQQQQQQQQNQRRNNDDDTPSYIS